MLLLCAYIEHQVYEKFTLFPEFAEEEEKKLIRVEMIANVRTRPKPNRIAAAAYSMGRDNFYSDIAYRCG